MYTLTLSKKTSRKSVMAALRKNVAIKSAYTFSDKRVKSQRLKLWATRNVIQTGHLIELYFIAQGYKGIKVETHLGTGHTLSNSAQPSVVITFDNDYYN